MTVSLDVLILAAFDDLPGVPSEVAPWLDRYALEGRLSVPGVPREIAHGDGIGVVPTGIGKTAAASTTTALLASDRLDSEDGLVVSVGVAGGNPATATLGSVVLATSIVDWDDKLRFDPDGADPPIAPNPYTGEQGVYHLDDERVSAAANLAKQVDLLDDPALAPYRDRPDHGVENAPTTVAGPNVCGDELWHGREVAAHVEWLLDRVGVGPPATTEMEDVGTARALDRFDRLDDYLSIRAIANFDRPPSAGSATSLAGAFEDGAPIAVENAVAVAGAIVDHHRQSA